MPEHTVPSTSGLAPYQAARAAMIRAFDPGGSPEAAYVEMSAVLGRLAPGALSLAAAIQGEAVMGRPVPHAWIRRMDRIVEHAVAARSLHASASAMSRDLDDVRTALQSACDKFDGLHEDLQEIRTGLDATSETYRELEEAMDRYLGGGGDAFLAWAEAYLEMKLLDAPRSHHSQRRKEMLMRLRSHA